MSYKLIVSKPPYNALTDTNIDHLQFSSDYNTLKYSMANGSKTVNVVTSASGYYNFQEKISHNLGYKPFFKAYVFLYGYTPVGLFTIVDNHNIHLMVTVDENKMYFIASGFNVETIIGTDLSGPYTDLFNNYNEEFCEVVDSGSLNQCVDLVVAWLMQLGFEATILGGVLNAYEIYTNPPANFRANFDRIAYSVANSPPQKGDIVVFSSAMGGGAGHTGVATGEGDSSSFKLFQQNDDPPGGNPNLTSRSHVPITPYPYTNVLGWFRKIGSGTLIETDDINYTAVFKYKIFKNKLGL